MRCRIGFSFSVDAIILGAARNPVNEIRVQTRVSFGENHDDTLASVGNRRKCKLAKYPFTSLGETSRSAV